MEKEAETEINGAGSVPVGETERDRGRERGKEFGKC